MISDIIVTFDWRSRTQLSTTEQCTISNMCIHEGQIDAELLILLVPHNLNRSSMLDLVIYIHKCAHQSTLSSGTGGLLDDQRRCAGPSGEQKTFRKKKKKTHTQR